MLNFAGISFQETFIFYKLLSQICFQRDLGKVLADVIQNVTACWSTSNTLSKEDKSFNWNTKS